MKSHYKKLALIVLLFALVNIGILSAQEIDINRDSGKDAGSSEALVQNKVNSAAGQKAVLDFWTREEIANAQPMEMPFELGPAEADESAFEEAAGEPGSSAPIAAAPGADQVAQAAYPQAWAAAEDLEAGALDASIALAPDTISTYTPYWLNRFKVSMKMFPHRYMGRLSFTNAGGGTSYCSAAATIGNNIVTAAHCIYDTTSNVWFSNWAFVPSYRYGWTPYGTFPWAGCTILTAWISLTGGYNINTWAPYDVGVCTMGTNSGGQSLNAAVGGAGYEWNFGYIRHVHQAGYPWRDYNNLAIPWAGRYLHTCVGETFLRATDVRGVGCNMASGISGGPWLRDYALMDRTRGWITGVSSGVVWGSPNSYGARFTSNNIVPLCNARGC